MSGTYRFVDDNETAQTRNQYDYINERILPSMQLVYSNSVDMPEKIGDNQLLITKDDGSLYVWWNGRLKKLNFEKANFHGGGSDSAAPDSIVVVYDDTELAGKEPHENTLYIIRRTGTIKYYDGQQYEVLFNNENAHKVNGHTVESNVPKDAKFTDTTYEAVDENGEGLMTPELLAKLNATVSKKELEDIVNNLESRDDFETGIACKADLASVYTREEIDQMRSESSNDNSWKAPAETKEKLSTEGAKPGDITFVQDENTIYIYKNAEEGWKNLLEKVVLPGNATESKDGFMSSADKKFLDEIPSKYSRQTDLDEVKKSIPDVKDFIKKVEVQDIIDDSIAPLAQQKVVDDLAKELRTVKENVPNAYSKAESDNRYMKVADKQDLSGFALKTDIEALPRKEDFADYVKQTDLGKYARIEMLDAIDNKFMQKSEADITYASKAPSGSSYVLSTDLEKYALTSELKQLRETVATLQRQLEEFLDKKDRKGIVIGYAVMDDAGNPMDEFLGIEEYKLGEDFTYVTNFAKENAFRDNMCVRLFSNLQDVETKSGAILHSKTPMEAYAMLHTNVAGPYYYLTKPIHVTEDFELEVKNIKSVEQGANANG